MLSVSAALLFSTAAEKSPVYDELIYPSAGLIQWKTGDFSINKTHPPLQKLLSGLPLLWARVPLPAKSRDQGMDEWRTGYLVFFQDLTHSRKWIFLSRIPTVLISLLLLLTVFIWLFIKHGVPSALVGTSLLAFDPLVLGNGSLALNDLFVTFFFFLSVALFFESLNGAWWKSALCGISMGAAIASKFSGIILPVLFFIFFCYQQIKNPRKQLPRLLLRLAVIFICGTFFILAIYQFKPSLFLDALKTSLFLRHGEINPGFLLGPISSHATWIYYPVALLIKTPIPILIIWIYSPVFLIKTKNNATLVPFFIFITGFIFLLAMASPNHFGLRYILPAVPFMAVASGIAFAKIKNKTEKMVFLLLVGWLAVETVFFHPHHMAYFNQFVGGPRNGYKWLDGSNQDWGQDLPALAHFLKKNGNPSLVLGYYGSAAPEAYGIQYQDAYSPAITNSFREEFINPPDPEKEYLAVSARLLADPQLKSVYGWLKEKVPIAFLGYTIFVYEITNDISAHQNLAQLYSLMGRKALLKREIDRIRRRGQVAT